MKTLALRVLDEPLLFLAVATAGVSSLEPSRVTVLVLAVLLALTSAVVKPAPEIKAKIKGE